MNILPGVLKRITAIADFNHRGYSLSKDAEESDLDKANVVTSKVIGDDGKLYHAPVIDIDRINVILIQSSTPGNYHLYIDKPTSWVNYKNLLKALYKCGIIEKGYLECSITRKYSSLRLPWVRK